MNRNLSFICVLIAISLSAGSTASQDLKLKEKEQVCLTKLAEVRELAKKGCSDKVRDSVLACLAAGVQIGACALEPTKITCIPAGIELLVCDTAAKAGKECQAKQKDWAKEIEALKEGECFAALGKNGECIFICEKRGPSFDMIGMLDLTKTKPSESFRYFPKK